ncbi:MAG: glutamate carboxypeptidase [Steroidobacteraceae bacterium]
MRLPMRVIAGVAAWALATAAGAAPHRDVRVYRAVEASRAGALELLRQIVDIDSGTGDVPGGLGVESVLAPRLEAQGAELERVPSEAAGLPDSLVAVWRGTGRARILIIAHIDTVFGPGTAAARPFSTEGDRAHGPGVGDEKAGVVTAMTALEILREVGFKHYASITLLLDNSEERGSPGSTQLIRRLARQSDAEFNMEPGDPPDALTVWRKGSADVRIHVAGRAAHAGMAPQDGRNAAAELVHQLSALEGAFPHSGSGTTVNLTLLKAGERSNIIPDSAEATLNVRYRSSADLESVIAKITDSAAVTLVPQTVVTILHNSAYPPLTENPAIDALAARAQSIYAEIGKTIARSGNGGASESAIAMSEGTPALDGLGLVGGDFHTDHEWVDLTSFTPRLYLFTRLLMDVSASPPSPRRAPPQSGGP